MLSSIEDTGRVVVKTNSADVYSITYPEVQSAAESPGQARVRVCEILRQGEGKTATQMVSLIRNVHWYWSRSLSKAH